MAWHYARCRLNTIVYKQNKIIQIVKARQTGRALKMNVNVNVNQMASQQSDQTSQLGSAVEKC